jgi:hypothetical protein
LVLEDGDREKMTYFLLEVLFQAFIIDNLNNCPQLNTIGVEK